MRGRSDYGITLDRVPREQLISLFPCAWGQGSFLQKKQEINPCQFMIEVYCEFCGNFGWEGSLELVPLFCSPTFALLKIDRLNDHNRWPRKFQLVNSCFYPTSQTEQAACCCKLLRCIYIICWQDVKQNNDSVDFLEYKKRKGNYTFNCFGNTIVKYQY